MICSIIIGKNTFDTYIPHRFKVRLKALSGQKSEVRRAMKTRRTRPLGQATRGKTALNRLRQVDDYVELVLSHCLISGVPLVVDIGFGVDAWTTLGTRACLLMLHP